MNVETFFANFGHLADARGGVQKLRELILQLAVQGKLVPQDSNDEPASVLSGRIRVEKERLVKEGKSKKGKKPAPLNYDDLPFELPEKWVWTRLGNALLKLTDGTHHSPASTESGDYKYVTAKNIKNDGVQLLSITYVTKEVHKEIYSRCNPEKGDLLYIKDGATTGIAAINDLDEPFSMLSSVALLKLPKEIFNRYLLHVLRSPFFYDLMREGMSGVAITRVTLTKMSNALVPLPPLEEQKRIVAKVDQLMALCNELAARQQKQQQCRGRLNNAALGALLTAREPDDHWQRIGTNFDLLYDHPETITKLRAAILQLAVQGKLVPQDPNDEAASVLLERIKAEKEEPSKKRGKRSKELAPINPSEVPFEVPKGWEWAKYGHVARIASNLVNPDDYQDAVHVAPDNIEKGNGRLLPCRTVKEDKVRSNKHLFFPGQIIYSKIRPNLSKATIVDFGGLCSADMYPVDAHLVPSFLLKYMLSEIFLSMAVKKDTRVAMPKINQEELNKVLVPVPPLEEQKRIVDKVDQLMALCDELEAKLNQSQQHSEKLMDATVRQLLVA